MNPHVKQKLKSVAIRTGIVLFIAAIQIVVFFISLESTAKKIYDKRSQILSLSQLSERRDQLQKEFGDVVLATVLLDDALPPAENPTKFRQVLDDIAKKSNLSQSFVYRSEEPIETDIPEIKKIPYTLTLEGSLEHFIDYLDEVQRVKSFIVIESISMSKTPPKDEFTTFVVQAFIFVR